MTAMPITTGQTTRLISPDGVLEDQLLVLVRALPTADAVDESRRRVWCAVSDALQQAQASPTG